MPSASAPRWRSPDAAKRFPTQLRAASRRSTQRIHAAPRRFATLRTASRRSAQRKVCSRGKTDSRVRQVLSTSELPGSPTGLPGSSKWNTFAKPCQTSVHYTGGSYEALGEPVEGHGASDVACREGGAAGAIGPAGTSVAARIRALPWVCTRARASHVRVLEIFVCVSLSPPTSPVAVWVGQMGVHACMDGSRKHACLHAPTH